LTIHAALLGRFGPAHAVQNQRQRQHPPRFIRVPRLRGSTPKPSRIQIHPSDCYSSRHDVLRESMQSQAITPPPPWEPRESQNLMPLVLCAR
jgi:hypothetical protein